MPKRDRESPVPFQLDAERNQGGRGQAGRIYMTESPGLGYFVSQDTYKGGSHKTGQKADHAFGTMVIELQQRLAVRTQRPFYEEQ